MKIFISYSHKDEQMLNELRKHLGYPEKADDLKIWDDRSMLAGDHLDESIKEALEECDVAVFLLSADFLSSVYCIEKELASALNQRKQRGLRVLGVVLRPCLWKETPLREYVALPKEGEAITKWADRDEAYLNVAEEILRIKNAFSVNESKKVSNIDPADTVLDKLEPQWQSYIESTDIAFQHTNKDLVSLADIFTFPDILDLEPKTDERTYFKIEHLTHIDDQASYLIYGDEQSGKTSLAKTLYSIYLKNGLLPLLIDGPDVATTNLEKLFKSAQKRQYLEDVFAGTKKRCILLIDNFHNISLNRKHQKTLIERLQGSGWSLVLLSDNNLRLQEYTFLESSTVHSLEILPFGHVKRQELVRRWNEIGVRETIDDNELLRTVAAHEKQINEIIRKNIVPTRPLYILTILQSLQALSPSDYRLTSYGHCYNYLIQSALKKAAISVEEIDSFFNLLTRFAFFLYKDNSSSCSAEDLDLFLRNYRTSFIIPDRALERLRSAQILVNRNSQITFSHKYIFYYFTGKAIAELVDQGQHKHEIEYLCSSLHRERNANILIFITHHSRSAEVIDEIATHSYGPFPERKPASLSIPETRFLAERLHTIPELALEQRDAEAERKREAEARDSHDSSVEAKGDDEHDPELQESRSLLDINSSAKSVEIIGQIVKNRHGSLSREQILTLTEAGAECGFRFLAFFLSLIEAAEADLVHMISRELLASEGARGNSNENQARSLYVSFCYGGVLSVLYKVGMSLGHKKLLPIIEQMAGMSAGNNVAAKLVNIIVKLEHSRNFPREEVRDLFIALEGNVVGQRLLKEIVVNHLYMHYLDRREKQWIATELKIPLRTQHRIEGKTKHKMVRR